jgi:hypothetical protein
LINEFEQFKQLQNKLLWIIELFSGIVIFSETIEVMELHFYLIEKLTQINKKDFLKCIKVSLWGQTMLLRLYF